MLKLYRRHRVSCPHRSENYRRCQCPVYVKGTLGGTHARLSLEQTNWDAASQVVAGWTKAGRIGTGRVDQTIAQAAEDFLLDAKSRGLADATYGKYDLLLARLRDYCREQHDTLLASVTLDTLSKFRATWPGAPLTRAKTQERLKAFFNWCVKRHWLVDSPAEGLSTIKVVHSPTLPLSNEEVAAILSACGRYPTRNAQGHDNRARMKAMVLLLRWSGLRIRDAVTLRRDAIKDGELFLYTQKTGTPVTLPLPHECATALIALHANLVEEVRPFYFWSGNGHPKSAVADWQRALRALFDLAGVTGAHPHRFRDTFAVELLLSGASLLDVSMLLGHSSVKITEKHYAPFVKERAIRLGSVVRQSWAVDTGHPAPGGTDTPSPPPTQESATPGQS